ncbi:MAG: hypothetical protein QOH93_1879 [Chloroflexia bacterium]|nr:hypothetical protein [Chloroflexia bacterium]
MQRGIAASEAGDKQTANAIFRQVAEYYPNNLEVWVWLGWSSPNLDEAEAAFTRAAQLDPGNEEVALGLRWVSSQRPAAPQPAMEMEAQPREEAPQTQQEQQTWEEQPVAQASPTMSVAEDVPQYDPAPRQSPARSVNEMLHQAVRTVQSGDKSTANRMFEHILSQRASDPDIWVWFGGTSNNLDDAETAFRRAREIDPFNEKATLGLRWVSLRRQLAFATAMPSTLEPVASTAESAPRKEGFFSRFFKRFSRSS